MSYPPGVVSKSLTQAFSHVVAIKRALDLADGLTRRPSELPALRMYYAASVVGSHIANEDSLAGRTSDQDMPCHRDTVSSWKTPEEYNGWNDLQAHMFGNHTHWIDRVQRLRPRPGHRRQYTTTLYPAIESECTTTVTRTVAPAFIRQCDTSTITVTVRPTCPVVAAHIAFVLDQIIGSSQPTARAYYKAVSQVLDRVRNPGFKAAIVWQGDRPSARLDVPLTASVVTSVTLW
jgi:hypothetical protein